MQRPSYKVFNYTLAAGEQVNIHHTANSLNCLSGTARFQIAFDDAPLTIFEKGLGYNTPVGFSKVRLLNDGAETLKVELGFASGGVTDSRLNLPSAIDANITNDVTVRQPLARRISDSKVTAAARGRTEIAASNQWRREILISNLGAETVYLGGIWISNGEGLPLGGGKTATLKTTAGIKVHNPTDTAIKLSVLEFIA